jgi:hypothetical protein
LLVDDCEDEPAVGGGDGAPAEPVWAAAPTVDISSANTARRASNPGDDIGRASSRDAQMQQERYQWRVRIEAVVLVWPIAIASFDHIPVWLFTQAGRFAVL